eukprot:1807986-Rhodomonas_salina.1
MLASGYYVRTYTFVIQDAGEVAFAITDDSDDDGLLQLLATSSSSSEAGSESGTPRPGTPLGPVNISDLDSTITQEISSVESIVAEESHVVLDPPDCHEVVNVLASVTAITFIAYVTSTWIVFMTRINVSDMISTSTSHLSHAFTATMGVANDTIFHIRQSNIAAFMQIGWVAMISAATILGIDLSGKDTTHFLFYYWTATTHFMILWSLYLSLTDYPMPDLRGTATHDQRATPTRVHNEPSPADQDHLSYAYAGQATITPNILIAAANALESRLYVYTGCSISIVKDTQLLTNVRNVTPIHVQGVAGGRYISEAGDLHFLAADNAGIYSTIVINNVLLDCD